MERKLLLRWNKTTFEDFAVKDGEWVKTGEHYPGAAGYCRCGRCKKEFFVELEAEGDYVYLYCIKEVAGGESLATQQGKSFFDNVCCRTCMPGFQQDQYDVMDRERATRGRVVFP